MTEPSSLEPSIALAAYAEPLATNRRVLVFGNALGSLPLQLLERGARSVHVCDPDALRVSEAAARNRSTQIAFSSLADSDLSLREAAFELALIDNLAAFDPQPLLRTAKRALGSRGVAVVACPNPEAHFPLLRAGNPAATSLDYYALYDAVAAEFEHVRMLGQTPFVGYAIADFSASGEPEPALDTSFVPGGAEEPDFFLALASNQEVRLDEFAVIQLPTRRLLGSLNTPPARVPAPAAVAPAAASENSAQARTHEAELGRLNQWIKELESRASTADERADHSETELETERAKLEAELETARAKLEAELETERAKLEAERKASGTLRSQHDKEISALRAELSALRTQATNLRADASSKASELGRLTSELAERNRLLAEQAEKLEQGSTVELAEYERQLSERGSEVRRLEQDLRTAERTGRELVRELERRRGEQSKQASLELERALAEREADLQAAAWTIESLSLRLELAGKVATEPGLPPETAQPGEEAR
jgi:SAM-dependent methyltransferase